MGDLCRQGNTPQCVMSGLDKSDSPIVYMTDVSEATRQMGVGGWGVPRPPLTAFCSGFEGWWVSVESACGGSLFQERKKKKQEWRWMFVQYNGIYLPVTFKYTQEF